MPGMDINAAALKAVAAVLVQLASAVTDDGAQTVREWRRSQEFYVAPESPALLGALDPLIERARAAGDRIGGLRPVLDRYAREADRIITEIRRLEAAPATDAAGDAEQARRIAELEAELDGLEADTAAQIRGLFAAGLVPPRVRVSEEVVNASFGLTGGGVVGGITFGADTTFKITRFSDGTVHVTAFNGQEAGGVLHTPLGADLSGGLAGQVGNTWRFQDEAEYQRFQGQISEAILRQQQLLDPYGGAQGVALAEELRPLRPPDLRVTEAAVPVSVALNSDRIPGLEVNGNLETTFKHTVSEDVAAQTTTTTVNREYTGGSATNLTPGAGVVGAGGGGTLSSGTGAVRDANGQLTRVVLTTTERSEEVLGAGLRGEATPRIDPNAGRHSKDLVTGRFVDETTEADVRVTTTSIPISTPEERALAEEFLAREADDAAGALDDRQTYRPDRAVPGDAFQNLAHSRGIVTEQDFREVTTPNRLEAGVDAGPEAGFEAGTETTRTELSGNRYLEPPGGDGVRRPAPTP